MPILPKKPRLVRAPADALDRFGNPRIRGGLLVGAPLGLLAGVETDPYFANIVTSLHFDGSDASTTFTDSGPSAKTWVANGNAQLDTAQFKFGTASLLLDGSGDFIDTGSHADWNFGTGAFTVQAWKRYNALPSAGNYAIALSSDSNIGGANGVPYWGIRNVAGTYTMRLTDDANTIEAVSDALSLSTGAWYHMEIARSSNTIYFFLDGVAKGTYDVTGKSFNFNVNSSGVLIGAQGPVSAPTGNYFDGWLDDFVVHKGVGLHTAGFTPRTSAWPDS